MDITKRSGYEDFVWAVKLNRLGLEMCGLWPRNDKVAKTKFAHDLRMATIFVLMTFVCGIPLVCSLIRVRGHLLMVVDNLPITLSLIVSLMKLVIFRWKQTVLLSIVNMMAEDWIAPKMDIERNVMISRARIAQLIVIIGYVLMIIAFLTTIILPCFGFTYRQITNLTDSNRPLLLQTYYFYDTDKSPQFEVTLFLQVLTMFFTITIYALIDAFFGLVIFHICGQLENFKRRLTNLISCKNFDRALRDNMQTHVQLIRFAANVENIFTLVMLGLIFYLGVLFCLFGFLFVIILSGDKIYNMSAQRIVFVVVAIVVVLTHMFFYCAAGEIVREHCMAVHRATCDLEWYRLEPNKGRTLILLMIRTNEPFYITAGKVFPLTMTTFCNLLKTSTGYISVLLAIREIKT